MSKKVYFTASFMSIYFKQPQKTKQQPNSIECFTQIV